MLVATGTYRTLFTRVVYTEWIFFGLHGHRTHSAAPAAGPCARIPRPALRGIALVSPPLFAVSRSPSSSTRSSPSPLEQRDRAFCSWLLRSSGLLPGGNAANRVHRRPRQ